MTQLDDATRAQENYEALLTRFNDWCGDILGPERKENMRLVMQARFGVLDPDHPRYDELMETVTHGLHSRTNNTKKEVMA